MFSSIFKEKAENKDDFDVLDTKMEQSLSKLNLINQMLSGDPKDLENDRLMKLESESLELKTQLHEATQKQLETQARLEHVKEQNNSLQKQLDSELDKYTIDYKSWQDKLIEAQEESSRINNEYKKLQEEKQAIYDKWSHLQNLHDKEVQRKDQLELLLRENAKELKITTEAVLKREQKLSQHQQELIKIQQMMDEKDELLETYVKEAQMNSEETNQLLDTLNQLEKENAELKEQLENQPPTPVENENVPEEVLEEQTTPRPDMNSNFDSPLLAKLEPSKSNSRNSRIPVATNQRTLPQQDYTAEIQQLKENLAICNQKLMEKISQNKELESALERGNDHCEILRTSLNEAREESASRYRKMLDLMEENRILKEALNSESKR